MKKGHLTLLEGGKAVRTHPLDVQDDAEQPAKRNLLDLKLPLFAVALVAMVLAEVGVYFALGVDSGLWIALSVLVVFASLWYGQFWLAFLIFLWWLWLGS